MSLLNLPAGLYDHPLSEALRVELENLEPDRWALSFLDPAEAPQQLARYLRQLTEIALSTLPEQEKTRRQLALVNDLVAVLQVQVPRAISDADRLHSSGQLLQEVRSAPLLPGETPPPRPLIPLADSTLLVNAPSEPSVGLALQYELPSADRIDLLCAFIKWSGLRLLLEPLAAHLNSGRPLRVLTTVYLGATDRRALDWLVDRGADVRVSYDTRRTRLHAKAWLFHRASGASTAFIGSSNLSTAALLDGLEWNVRLSALENPAVVQKFQATFESYWEEGEFEPYLASDAERQRIDRALGTEGANDADAAVPVFFDIRPYTYQQEILDRLEAERLLHQRWRNLVVAATGTGKTVMAALDYQRLPSLFSECFPSSEPPRLLFIAHRKEILQQSLATFRQVLRDGSFGELYVDGQRPEAWRHVFASVQSLASLDPAELPADHFEVVIIDEFHHAASASYSRWLDYLNPRLLLGLTATPERADGLEIMHWFGGRIAAELRLWSALDQGLLTPFHYFGVHDDTDLSQLEWRRGGYAPEDLSALYSGDDHRVSLILRELHAKVNNPERMRALGFCVSVEHATFMARRFRDAGLAAEALSSETPRELRQGVIARLRRGELCILFAVDLFNEGLDIPEIDTVLFLRPTESAVVFLQQLGRGLRLSEGKSCLTVLDFIGQQHRRFGYDQRFRALIGGSRRQLEEQLGLGFPFMPSGCRLVLDRVAQRQVLNNLRACIPSRRPQLLAELRALAADGVVGPSTGLPELLHHLGLEPEEFYAINGIGLTALQRELSWLSEAPTAVVADETRLTRAIGAGLLHIDDPERLVFYKSGLAAGAPPDPCGLSQRQQRLWCMFTAQLFGTGAHWVPMAEALQRLWTATAMREELRQLVDLLAERTDHRLHPLNWAQPVPMRVHGAYTRMEIEGAFGMLNDKSPWIRREGVFFHQGCSCHLLFITLKKSEALFSPSTRYRDFALGPLHFHWESQSTTTTASPTGQRYIHHVAQGSRVLLFVREERKRDGVTLPFRCLGFATYESHEGERPMAIRWRLECPIPAAWLPTMNLAV